MSYRKPIAVLGAAQAHARGGAPLPVRVPARAGDVIPFSRGGRRRSAKPVPEPGSLDEYLEQVDKELTKHNYVEILCDGTPPTYQLSVGAGFTVVGDAHKFNVQIHARPEALPFDDGYFESASLVAPTDKQLQAVIREAVRVTELGGDLLMVFPPVRFSRWGIVDILEELLKYFAEAQQCLDYLGTPVRYLIFEGLTKKG